MVPSPGQELLGAVTSHGPFRECNTRAQKSSGRPTEASEMPAVALSAERLRAAVSSATSGPAVLQREMPGGSAEVVAVESAAEVPNHSGRQAETQRAKPALPGTRQEPEAVRTRGG